MKDFYHNDDDDNKYLEKKKKKKSYRTHREANLSRQFQKRIEVVFIDATSTTSATVVKNKPTTHAMQSYQRIRLSINVVHKHPQTGSDPAKPVPKRQDRVREMNGEGVTVATIIPSAT